MWGSSSAAAVSVDEPVDPADIVPDFGVDPREVRVGTPDAPGHDALKAAVANQRASRVSL